VELQRTTAVVMRENPTSGSTETRQRILSAAGADSVERRHSSGRLLFVLFVHWLPDAWF